MKFKFISILIILTMFIPSSIFASEEEYLRWKNINILCFETEETGEVSCNASTNETDYSKFEMQTFGKRYQLDKSQLNKLKGFPLSSLKITHEAGYIELGGHTVHFRMRKINYNVNGQLMEEEIIISISKGKGLDISDIIIKEIR